MTHTITTTQGVVIPLHTLHKALWTWLARTGAEYKDAWPGWEWNGGNVPYVRGHCFACEANYIRRRCIGGRGCDNCPVFSIQVCCDYNSLFDCWNHCENQGWRKHYARMILDLGWMA